MYATIRRYSTKTSTNRQTIQQLQAADQENFVPKISEIRGFHSYGVSSAGNNELSRSASSRIDRERPKPPARQRSSCRRSAQDQLSKPEVLEGELLVLMEAELR